MPNNIKLLPYGETDFVRIRTSNLYFVDKSMYLPLLENEASTIIFIRPRRFGKSSFISMMKAYYDKKKAKRFDELFGGLYIGSHPTDKKNQYQVMHFDFSLIVGDTSVLKENFNKYCGAIIDAFITKYADDYNEAVVNKVLEEKYATIKLNIINIYASEHNIPLYLIIDEYDNFTNVVLNEEGHDVYYKITHASGFYRDVYKIFKAMFERIFITGISPVTLDDLTSGFNIGMNISLNYQYNEMLGFSTSDVKTMIEYYRDEGLLPQDIDADSVIEEMKPWYDNYCFSKNALQKERMFNTDMVLNYLKNYISMGFPPEDMVDPNTRTDYAKLKRLLQLDRLEGDRRGIIKQIAEEGEIVGTIKSTFPADQIVKSDTFVSLLYYYGMLTITGTKYSRLCLGIPNNNVRKQYYEYMLEMYKEQAPIKIDHLQECFDEMAFEGKWEDAIIAMTESYKQNSAVRSAIEGERNIQGFFTALLSLNNYYLLAPEMEFSHGYCDLFLMPDHRVYKAEHSYIIELKYLHVSDTEEKAEKQWQEAVDQVNRYAADERLQAMLKGTALHKIIVQMKGAELFRMEEV